MARVIKKISDLEMLEGLTSTSNVIVEDGGEAKLFPAANIGSVKTVNGIEPDENGNIEVEIPDVEIPEINYPVTSVNGQTGDVVIEVSSGSSVQADLSQNDSAQPDYVKNRTHWVEGSGATIEWDGNTEGRDSFTIEDTGVTFYKVSDITPSKNELLGGTMTALISGNSTEYILNDEGHMFVEGDNCLIVADLVFVVTEAEANFIIGENTMSASAPSTGVYFGLMDGPTYAAKLTYGSTTYHPLDEAFIPDTVARKSDIPEVNYPVTSVNGMTGDVVIEAGSGGGVTSWNDLEDKPFYEENNKVAVVENEVVQLSAGGGSNYGGPTSSPIVLTDGEKYTVIVDGEEYAMTAFEGAMQGLPCVCLGDISILNDDNTTPDTPICLAYAASHSMTLVGVVGAIEEITLSVYKGSTIVHPLDDKFIPDTIARVEDVPNVPVTSVNGMTGDVVVNSFSGSWNDLTDKPSPKVNGVITWDGSTSGRETFKRGSIDYYKVSDLPSSNLTFTRSENSNGSYLDSTNPLFTFTEGEGATAYDGNLFIVVYSENFTIGSDSWEGIAPGVYFGKMTYNSMTSYTTSVTYKCPVPDAVGETVTAAEFNALLAALREAGYLAT